MGNFMKSHHISSLHCQQVIPHIFCKDLTKRWDLDSPIPMKTTRCLGRIPDWIPLQCIKRALESIRELERQIVCHHIWSVQCWKCWYIILFYDYLGWCPGCLPAFGAVPTRIRLVYIHSVYCDVACVSPFVSPFNGNNFPLKDLEN